VKAMLVKIFLCGRDRPLIKKAEDVRFVPSCVLQQMHDTKQYPAETLFNVANVQSLSYFQGEWDPHPSSVEDEDKE